MKDLKLLPKKLDAWRGKRVLVRVDWNVPLDGTLDAENSLRITRSLPLIYALQEVGAIVIILTHVGRPAGVDETFSTKHLVPLLKKQGVRVAYHAELSIGEQAREGSVHLLENMRFFPGEEKNTAAFAKKLASVGDVFVMDAFAVSHRMHASVVGITKFLPSFAGPAFLEECAALAPFVGTSKKLVGGIAFFGGKKISTKLPAILALTKCVESVFLGGALAVVCEKARGREVGKSFVEEKQERGIKQLLASKRVILPLDYVVAPALTQNATLRYADGDDIKPHEYVVDVGPRTLAMWANAIREAKMCLWNGPMGLGEISAFSAGSRGLARYLGYVGTHATTIVGGGDTIPILTQAGVMERISFVSTGGGAMLEYLIR